MRREVDRSRGYSPIEAFEKVVQSGRAKFSESVDVAINLSIDAKKSEEQVRGIVDLPHGIGRQVRVAVFTGSADISGLLDAGADIVGGEELIEQIRLSGRAPDVAWCISEQGFMPKVSAIAKILGPRGLMPNPKFGTVTANLVECIRRIKAGMVKFKVDKAGVLHVKIGNVGFKLDCLVENFDALMHSIRQVRPVSVKNNYVKSVFVSTTMGASVKVNV